MVITKVKMFCRILLGNSQGLDILDFRLYGGDGLRYGLHMDMESNESIGISTALKK